MKENPYYLDPEDSPSQTINEKLCNGTVLIGWGNRGHGMNGKDADLDSTGQCLVKSLETLDPIKARSMKIRINLRLYANVCEPYVEQQEDESEEDWLDRYKQAMDVATEVVCGSVYSGYWTGSDYWCFGIDVKLEVDLAVDEYEMIEDGSESVLQQVGQRIADAIYKGNTESESFENEMRSLNEAIGRNK